MSMGKLQLNLVVFSFYMDKEYDGMFSWKQFELEHTVSGWNLKIQDISIHEMQDEGYS